VLTKNGSVYLHGVFPSSGEEKYFSSRLTRRKVPFDLQWVKNLHVEMFGDVWAWAGEFRKTNTSVGVDKYQIQTQMIQLLNDVNAWPEMGMNPIEQGARLHHRSVFIHPFVNGNGRWSRMLTNVWLRLNKYPLVVWPTTLYKESPIRKEYIAALKEADLMNYDPLISIHREYQER
jgi:Fic-DOC domain mobile mystery protein B